MNLSPAAMLWYETKGRGCFCAVYFWAVLSSRLQMFIWLVLKGKSTKGSHSWHSSHRGFLAMKNDFSQSHSRLPHKTFWRTSFSCPVFFDLSWLHHRCHLLGHCRPDIPLHTSGHINRPGDMKHEVSHSVSQASMQRWFCLFLLACIQGNLHWHWIPPPVSRDRHTHRLNKHRAYQYS